MASDASDGFDPIAALRRQSPVEVRRVFAQRVREHRIAHNWTQREMAARAGIVFETYRAFERTGHIAFDRLLRVLDVLGLLDTIELVPPIAVDSIDDVVNQHAERPRQRARSAKRSLPSEPSR